MDLQALLLKLVDILSHPEKDPTQTALVGGSILSAFLVIILVAFILLPSDDSDEEDGDWDSGPREPAKPPSRFWKHFYTGATVLIVGLLIGAAWYGDARTRDNAFCQRCHALEESVTTWKDGSHSKVACVACHESPGALGFVDSRARALQNLLQVRNAGKDPQDAVLDQEACYRCHEQQMEKVIEVRRLRVRHSDFAKEIACGQCHGRVGHQASDQKIASLGSTVMVTCMDCHDLSGAESCSVCHVGDLAYANTNSQGFAKRDLPAPDTCRGCHDLAGCTACHGVEMPHPENFEDPKLHARLGAFGNPACFRCHDEGCKQCHRSLPEKHGRTDWKKEHQAIKDGRSCVGGCHSPARVGDDMCKLCHDDR